MRFATFIVVGACALFANAQSTDSATSTTATAASTVSLTPAQSSAAACLNACDAGDVDCQAKCIAVPSPSGSQVNATTECVANCDQGNGTATDNANYADCVNTCIDDNYFTAGAADATGTATGTAASSDATATGTAASKTSGSSASSTGTASSSSSSSTSSSSSDAIRVGATGLSLLAMLAGFMAL